MKFVQPLHELVQYQTPQSFSVFSNQTCLLSALSLPQERFSVCLLIYTKHVYYYFECYLYFTPFSITHNPTSPAISVPPLSHLVCSHLALWGFGRVQAFIERRLDGLHLSGNGLEGLLIMLLPLQSLVQTLLLLTDLW